jgi:hypothetical protein
MSQITSLQIVRDHLAITPGSPKPALNVGLEIGIFVIGAGAGVLVWLLGIETRAAGVLLTATSIMTGLTFTMAMRFWERSLDARSNPDFVFDNERKQVLDSMRTLLLWTVLAGILSTGWLAALALVLGDHAAAAWSTGVSAGLVAYLLLNVLRSLLSLYWSSYTLRP